MRVNTWENTITVDQIILYPATPGAFQNAPHTLPPTQKLHNEKELPRCQVCTTNPEFMPTLYHNHNAVPQPPYNVFRVLLTKTEYTINSVIVPKLDVKPWCHAKRITQTVMQRAAESELAANTDISTHSHTNISQIQQSGHHKPRRHSETAPQTLMQSKNGYA